jgi:hypothetical protein
LFVESPGVALHAVVDGLPSGAVGETFPVIVLAIGVGMVPKGDDVVMAAGDVIATDDIDVDVVVADDVDVLVMPGMDIEAMLRTVNGAGTGSGVMDGDGSGGTAGDGGAGTVVPGKTLAKDASGSWENVNGATAGAEELGDCAEIVGAAETDGIVPLMPTIAGTDATGTAGVAGAICPVDVQVTAVPGAVGSEAGGTAANVVSGAPGWVAAENGLGPLSGEVTIAPGVDGSPMAVVPMVATCARLALQPSSSAAAMNNKRRIAMTSSAPI